MGESDLAIEVRNLSKIFREAREDVRALQDANLSIHESEFFTLVGPSGCGKTTLLRLIAGFEQPSTGDVLLYGKSLARLPPYRRPVNTVFQSYALFPHLTVDRNVAFGLQMQGIDPRDIGQRVEEALALVKLEGYGSRRPQQLSGGQQQRVALARALANRPKVLLLDEPLSALDFKLRKGMQLELKRLQLETGITFIFVTHDQEEALTMSDRIAVMNEGRILQVGSPTEVYEKPADRFVADFIGDTNFLEARFLAADDSSRRFSLGNGVEIEVNGEGAFEHGQQVVLAVRPERVELTEPGRGTLAGTLSDVVYFGTDTTYHVSVDGCGELQIRSQNRAGAGTRFKRGDAV
ncbi:MAG: ABC transporter ATP-binding protein, partial [Gammaproteobacteria bacterium]|nr:ABC transporter ATP-binding protein [Gammaproteobacteria bacterium]